MLTINTIPPLVLAAQQNIKKYQKPSFEVINLDMESPLLAGSGTPSPNINPIKPSPSEW